MIQNNDVPLQQVRLAQKTSGIRGENMDINLARTFLAIVATGNSNRAAEQVEAAGKKIIQVRYNPRTSSTKIKQTVIAQTYTELLVA